VRAPARQADIVRQSIEDMCIWNIIAYGYNYITRLRAIWSRERRIFR